MPPPRLPQPPRDLRSGCRARTAREADRRWREAPRDSRDRRGRRDAPPALAPAGARVRPGRPPPFRSSRRASSPTNPSRVRGREKSISGRPRSSRTARGVIPGRRATVSRSLVSLTLSSSSRPDGGSAPTADPQGRVIVGGGTCLSRSAPASGSGCPPPGHSTLSSAWDGALGTVVTPPFKCPARVGALTCLTTVRWHPPCFREGT